MKIITKNKIIYLLLGILNLFFIIYMISSTFNLHEK